MGKDQPKILTKEEELVEKKKLFEKNLDMFISLTDIIIGVSLKTNQDGRLTPGVLINPGLSRSIIVQGLFDIENEVRGYIMHMDMESKKAKASNIIKPGDNGGAPGVNRIDGK